MTARACAAQGPRATPRIVRVAAWIVAGCLACVACDGSEPARSRPRQNDAGEERDAEVADAAKDAGEGDAALEPDAAPPVECNVTPPTVCDEPMPHYPDVAPIFQARCTSCHNGSDGFWPLTTYQHVADWYGEIRAQMVVCGMPPPASGSEMPLEERQLILRWIRCGFPK